MSLKQDIKKPSRAVAGEPALHTVLQIKVKKSSQLQKNPEYIGENTSTLQLNTEKMKWSWKEEVSKSDIKILAMRKPSHIAEERRKYPSNKQWDNSWEAYANMIRKLHAEQHQSRPLNT